MTNLAKSTARRSVRAGLSWAALAVVPGCGDPAAPEDAASVVITPAAVTVTSGEVEPLAVEVRDAAGRRLELAVSWRSADTSVATVSADGEVEGRLVGETRVSATVGSVSGDATITVEPGAPVAVRFERDSLTLFVTERLVLRAAAVDAAGNAVEGAVAWSSSDPLVVTVDGAGVARALRRGRARLEARIADAAAPLDVLVLDPLGLAFPLRGQLYRDFVYVNYVDQVARSGEFLDYACGPRTVDGHRGVDLALPSFARMDQGVTVVAAASGTVADVRDGLPDRNTEPAGDGPGNYVRVEHGEGVTSLYAHLATNSVAVAPGAVIAVGDTLGLVGSSGSSSHPHLHFELARGDEIIAAFTGDCGRSVGQWATPDPYQDTLLVVAAGISDLALSAELLKLPPPPVDTLATTDTSVAMWVSLHNVRAGSTSRFDLVSPSGDLFGSFEFSHPRRFTLSWWYLRYIIPGNLSEPGVWRFRFTNNGGIAVERDFVLLSGGQPAPPLETGAGPLKPDAGGFGLTYPSWRIQTSDRPVWVSSSSGRSSTVRPR